MHDVRQAKDSSFSISATPTLLQHSGEWVDVSFGIDDPNIRDWIAVYSPANVDITQTSPIKFEFANASSTYIHTGSGGLSFRIVNMHSDVMFAFFRNGTDFPIYIGRSNIVTFANLNEPLQPHLALTEKLNEMRLQWTTGYGENPQYVKWGNQSNQYTAQQEATTFTYTESDMCGPPANSEGWKDPGLLHTAVMTNLEPARKYYYRFGNDDDSMWSEEYSFVAPPVVAKDTATKVVAFGDLGKGEADGSEEHSQQGASLNTTANIIALAGTYDFVLHIGDLSYAMGYEAQWDEFFDQVAPIAGSVAYMTCDGNHERDYPDSGSYYNGTDSGGECGIPYDSRMYMPNNGEGMDNTWYSFNYGNAHYVVMSTEHDFQVGSQQYQFLEKDLQSVDRSKTPWVIFAGHRPMYIDSTNTNPNGGDQPVAEFLRANVEPLLVKYRVNIALWGHHHSYQRTCPVNHEVCQFQPNNNRSKNSYYIDDTHYPNPIHLVIGMAGAGLSQNLKLEKPVWLIYVNDQEHGYSTIELNETTLHMQYYSNFHNSLRDEFFIHYTTSSSNNNDNSNDKDNQGNADIFIN